MAVNTHKAKAVSQPRRQWSTKAVKAVSHRAPVQVAPTSAVSKVSTVTYQVPRTSLFVLRLAVHCHCLKLVSAFEPPIFL